MSGIAKNFMISRTVIKPSYYEISNAREFSKLGLRSTLAPVSQLYPNFSSWLNFKFIRNIQYGERKAIVAHDGNRILGVSLLKLTPNEKKICTLFVNENVRCVHSDMKIGSNLMERSLQLLNYDDVLITVCSEKNEELTPLLNKNSFVKVKVVQDLYNEGSSEYFYKLK